MSIEKNWGKLGKIIQGGNFDGVLFNGNLFLVVDSGNGNYDVINGGFSFKRNSDRSYSITNGPTPNYKYYLYIVLDPAPEGKDYNDILYKAEEILKKQRNTNIGPSHQQKL